MLMEGVVEENGDIFITHTHTHKGMQIASPGYEATNVIAKDSLISK